MTQPKLGYFEYSKMPHAVAKNWPMMLFALLFFYSRKKTCSSVISARSHSTDNKLGQSAHVLSETPKAVLFRRETYKRMDVFFHRKIARSLMKY